MVKGVGEGGAQKYLVSLSQELEVLALIRKGDAKSFHPLKPGHNKKDGRGPKVSEPLCSHSVAPPPSPLTNDRSLNSPVEVGHPCSPSGNLSVMYTLPEVSFWSLLFIYSHSAPCLWSLPLSLLEQTVSPYYSRPLADKSCSELLTSLS